MVERENNRRHQALGASIRQYVSQCSSSCTFAEFSGSLGDLGTFLPLVVALAATIQLDLGTTLLFTGLYNVLSGIGFKIPMCVQPMKTIAAVALATPGLSIIEAMSAGIFVSSLMLMLGLTGLMNFFNSLIPGCIVRGIQLAVGLQLAKKGIMQAVLTAPHAWRPWLGLEGLLLGLLTLVFLLVATVPAAAAAEAEAEAAEEDSRPPSQQLPQQQQQEGEHREGVVADTESAVGPCSSTSSPTCRSSSSSSGIPAALIIVVIGLILTPIASPSVLSHLSLGPSKPSLQIPTLDEFKSGVLKAGLAQLPLTSLNSVIAVSQLAAELFPARVAADGWRWRPGTVAVSVGLMNLMGCWWGAFPCCHGSGGLAAQYKFGARAGTSCIMLGLMKISLALLFGSSLLQLLQHFPKPLLGSMLLVAGIELASSARKEKDARGYCFMLLTAVAIVGLGDTALGFLVGLGGDAAVRVYELCYSKVWEWLRQRRSSSRKSSSAAVGLPVNGVKYTQLGVSESA